MQNRIISIFLVLLLLASHTAIACDDTLIMLLTAQNPTSQFSQVIRSFSTDLTALGLVLNDGLEDQYNEKLSTVMSAWLEFSKNYMNSPPEEARSDRHWTSKMTDTARSIGQIRKLVTAGNNVEAHDKVLELSSRLGTFFEAFGVSSEKQLFIDISANLISLERAAIADKSEEALALTQELKQNFAELRPMVPDIAAVSAEKTLKLINQLSQTFSDSQHVAAAQPEILELKTLFEELRSHILMMEWFPEVTQ